MGFSQSLTMAPKRHFLPLILRNFVQDDVVLDSELGNVGENVSLVEICDEIEDEVLELPAGVCESKLTQIKVLDTHVKMLTERTEKRPSVTDLSKEDANTKQEECKKKKVKKRPSISDVETKKKALKNDIRKVKKLSTKTKNKSSLTFKMKITSKLKLVLPKKKLKKLSNPINLSKSIAWSYKNILENRYKGDVKRNKNHDPDVCDCARVSPGEAGCGEDCINRMTLIECHPAYCVNGEDCTNNVIQKKQFAPGLQRFMTDGKGWGVRAQNTLRKGQYVMEYTGEVVDEDTFEKRMKTKYTRDKHHYCMALGGGLFIDAHRTGSECRFVNHSCEPNCNMIKWSVNGLSRMALFTMRKIRIGEEITYDYNFDNYNSLQGQTCRCGSKSCRGIIGGKGEVKLVNTAQNVKMQPVVKLVKCSKTLPSKSSKVTKTKKTKKEKPAKLDYRKVIKTKFAHRLVNTKFHSRQQNYLIAK